MSVSKRKISDLREAAYNPRVISEKRLDNLHKSMNTYGDLSGVVFNAHTKTLVSGHQRLSRLRKKGVKIKFDIRKVTDEFGTVAEGHIVATTDAGTIRIPYREVKWSDKKAEMAANVAANAHGGDFDRGKLGSILEKLSSAKGFDIDTIGIDPLSMRSLLPKMPNAGGGDKDDNESFQEYGEDSFDFEHQCPKCKFQFNSSSASKPKKKAEPQPKAPKLSKGKKDKESEKPSKKKKVDANKEALRAMKAKKGGKKKKSA